VAALKAKGFKGTDQLAHGRYTRNTLNVEDGLATVLDASIEPRAVIMVGAYAPCAKFIKLSREILPDTLFLNVSFVGSKALADALGPDGEGVVVTQVVPHFSSDLPAVKEYRDDLKRYGGGAEPEFVSLEGYMAARIFVEGIKAAGNPTRESIVDGLEGLKGVDVGIGMPVSYSRTEHQASHKVWPTVIKKGKFVSLNWKDLR
jgi:ABC-type branched-subunit amino acid transport system substrate-binding protein